MNRRALTAPAILGLGLGGCVVEAGRTPHHHDVVVTGNNYAPDVNWADGGCYWDDYYHDDIIWFEADVDDPNGVYDVVAVFADVYDERSGAWVDSFQLFPTNDPYTWFSDWLGSTTYVDCHYRGYVVDIVGYDALDTYGILSFYPYTY